MSEYKIHQYDSKIAEELAQVSAKVAENWAWPYFHRLASLENMSSKPDFDSSLLLYCTKDDEVVGYILAEIGSKFLGSELSVEKNQFARIIYPCTLPGHESAADLLLDTIIANLKTKGITLVRTRTSTMISNSFDYLKQKGYVESTAFPLGFKLYYQYKASKGKIDRLIPDTQLFNEERDLEECTKWVSRFFYIPEENAKSHILRTNSRDDLVSHLVIRVNDELVGYCFAHPNGHVKKIHATYYIEAINEDYFAQLLVKSVNNSIDAKGDTFIVDLIGSVHKYEKATKSLGFEKVATWCVFERNI
ncbi:MAG: hypothetical protein FK733_14490 [Asgard group archaeon]|nr:hypothetical protein [Asgard group archaeon]